MRKNIDKRLDTMGGVSARTGRQVEVVALALADAAPREFREVFDPATHLPAYRWSHEGHQFLVASASLRNEDPVVTSRYNLEEHIDTIFTQATSIDASDPDEILNFCNEWGILGCCEPDMPNLRVDSVIRCSSFLERLGKLALWLEAMQNGRWESANLPKLPAAKKKTRRGTNSGKFPSRRERLRSAFVHKLNELVWQMPLRPAVYLSQRRFEPVLEPRCLKEALAIELWQRATDSRLCLRQCRGCRGLYRVARSNSKRRFCGERCRRAYQQRNYYKNNRDKIADQRKQRRIENSRRA